MADIPAVVNGTAARPVFLKYRGVDQYLSQVRVLVHPLLKIPYVEFKFHGCGTAIPAVAVRQEERCDRRVHRSQE